MRLIDFLDMLADVEFSQTAIMQKDEQGRYVKFKELIGLVNRANHLLHTRFLIKKGDAFLNVGNQDRLRFDLRDDNNHLSIDDTKELIKVLEVWASDGTLCRINPIYRTTKEGYLGYYDVQMVNQYTLVFGQCDGCYRIVFQKGPKLIEVPESIDEFFPEDLEIDIGFEYIDALLFYVASRFFSVSPPLEGYGAQFSPGLTYTKRYEEECMKLELLNLEIDGVGDSIERFKASKFV